MPASRLFLWYIWREIFFFLSTIVIFMFFVNFSPCKAYKISNIKRRSRPHGCEKRAKWLQKWFWRTIKRNNCVSYRITVKINWNSLCEENPLRMLLQTKQGEVGENCVWHFSGGSNTVQGICENVVLWKWDKEQPRMVLMCGFPQTKIEGKDLNE